MKRGINVLLVADSNPWDAPPLMELPVLSHFLEPQGLPPIPLWDRIFAYTVTDAFNALNVGRIRMVHDAEDPAGQAKVLRGAVRFDDQVRDNHRVRRQGAFDNVHFAPPMQMKLKPVRVALEYTVPIATLGFPFSLFDQPRVPVVSVELSEADVERWGFNDVVMAPICAHDCFHLHWRWSETPVLPTDQAAFGWGGAGVCGQPYVERGQPLIPKNQELFVRLTSQRSLIYEVTARRVEAKVWQIVGHHGAGYVTKTKSMVDTGRKAQDAFAETGASGFRVPRVYAEGDVELSAKDHWAVFYWRNRYTILSDGVAGTNGQPGRIVERTEINDLQAILTGVSRPGRH
jgi:hypothetical protein